MVVNDLKGAMIEYLIEMAQCDEREAEFLRSKRSNDTLERLLELAAEIESMFANAAKVMRLLKANDLPAKLYT